MLNILSPLIIFIFIFSSCSEAHVEPYLEFPDSIQSNLPLVILGDTQKTSLAERVIFRREKNKGVSKKILNAISKEEIAGVIHLGDAIFNSASKKEWNQFDTYSNEIRDKKIPMQLLMGNHEYWGHDYFALKNVFKRFKSLEKSRWSFKIYNNIGLIFIDSNVDSLSREKWQQQLIWYRSTIKKLEADPTISSIIVFSHHPPFSNSELTGDEEHVQKSFVPEFFKSKKAIAFFAGHAHGFERFIKKGKSFIVSAGGGGPRVKYSQDPKHRDLSSLSYPRPFHYLVMKQKDLGLSFEMKGFNLISEELQTIDQFEIRFK